MNNQWINKMYEEVLEEHKTLGLSNGMAIFYTPVKYTPKILLIGDNPGGINGKVWRRPPEKHDYFLSEKDDYLFAKKMRLIFSGKELNELLKNSVKINRVFFQSKSINQNVGWNQLEGFCSKYVKDIICKVDPKVIITESVGAFNWLINEFEGKFINEPVVVSNNKKLLRSGRIKNKLVLGLSHPTGTRGISNDEWRLVTKKLNEILIRDIQKRVK